MVLDQVHDCMDPPVDPFLLFTEVHLQRLFLVSGHMDRMADQLLDPLSLGGGNGDHRNSQGLLHFVDQHRTAVFPELIHHI